ncbi:hypothetical protein AGMMS49940_15340 [Spirochaetia bacterium]|nr:hypothetical protein AGMMS49940_15340 [Spirochaetia bacterium]
MRLLNAIIGKIDLSIKPEDIPLLVPEEQYNGLGEVYDAVVKWYHGKANGGRITSRWWNSAANYIKVNKKPIMGSANGHGADEMSLYTYGIKTDDEAAYTRISIPNIAANEALILACKQGVAEFSNICNCELIDGEYGEQKGEEPPYIDAVRRGAIKQELCNSADEKEYMDLIRRGRVDYKSDSTETIVNGKVCRNAFKKMLSDGNKKLANNVLQAIAKRNRSNGMKKYFNAEGDETGVGPDDALEAIKKAIESNLTSKVDVAKSLGLELVDKEAEAMNADSAETLAAVAEVLGLPPESKKADLLFALEALDEAVAEVETNKRVPEGKTLKNGAANPVWVHCNKAVVKNLRNLKAVDKELEDDVVYKSLKIANAQGVKIANVVTTAPAGGNRIWG